MKHFIFVCVVAFMLIVIMSGSLISFAVILAIILTAKRFKNLWLHLYKTSLKIMNMLV